MSSLPSTFQKLFSSSSRLKRRSFLARRRPAETDATGQRLHNCACAWINFSHQDENWARNPLWRERISTVDLHVLTISDQLVFILKPYFSFYTKQPISMRRSTVLSLPLRLEFPALAWFSTSGCMCDMHLRCYKAKPPYLKLKVQPGKSYWRGRLSTVDLLVLTSLDQLLFIMKNII